MCHLFHYVFIRGEFSLWTVYTSHSNLNMFKLFQAQVLSCLVFSRFSHPLFSVLINGNLSGLFVCFHLSGIRILGSSFCLQVFHVVKQRFEVRLRFLSSEMTPFPACVLECPSLLETPSYSDRILQPAGSRRDVWSGSVYLI